MLQETALKPKYTFSSGKKLCSSNKLAVKLFNQKKGCLKRSGRKNIKE